MKIKWLGHSCFLMTSESGIRLLTDPFIGQVGYTQPDVEADIVTISHGHYDHNYIKAVKGEFTHIKEPGKYIQDGINISGISTYHDEVGGKERGSNVVFIFEIDELRICHCGDLGHLPNSLQIEEIGRVDVLLVPIGSVYTIDAAGAANVIKLLKPSICIPMHYKTPALSFTLDGVDEFLKETGAEGHLEVFAHEQEVEITSSNLKTYPKILVLDYE